MVNTTLKSTAEVRKGTHSVLKAKANVVDEDDSACEGFSVEDHAWTTQMILNRSSLGTIFNQWPTRRVES